MVEYINQLRARGIIGELPRRRGAAAAAHHDDHAGGHSRMLPAAISHGIGSDSQRPFAIVIVGGLIVDLVLSIFILPTLYVFWARKDDKLPPPEISFLEEGEHVD